MLSFCLSVSRVISCRHQQCSLYFSDSTTFRFRFAFPLPCCITQCIYADTFDGHWLIDHHPVRKGIFVATGGSGHAFKFAPILGQLVGMFFVFAL
jgi:hypothetical protein